MTHKLDQLDRKILNWLWRDARTSNRAIARALRVSEGTVRGRIKRMKEEKSIRISAVTHMAALGRPVFAFLGIEVDRSRLSEVAQKLCAVPQIRFVGMMLGRYDILAMAQLSNSLELAGLLTDTLASIPGVRTTESWQGLEVIKHDYRWGRITGNGNLQKRARPGPTRIEKGNRT